MNQDGFDVFVGLDVGKDHHTTILHSAGKRLHDKALPQNESALRKVFATLTGHGSVGDRGSALHDPSAASDRGASNGYPGRLPAWTGDVPHRRSPPGQREDRRPRRLYHRRGWTHYAACILHVGGDDNLIADLAVIIEFDDDLAGEVNRVSNRIRSLLTQIQRLSAPSATTSAAPQCWHRSPSSAAPPFSHCWHAPTCQHSQKH